MPDPDGEQPEYGSRSLLERAARDRSLRALRARWRTASLASGWRFPGDWALPEVDVVCAAVLDGGGADPAPTALAGLGRARAGAGAGLAETLADLAALHAVLADPHAKDGFVAPDVDAIPARSIRVTAVAWAEVALDGATRAEVTDPLTGLPTIAYLRTRLGELYRQAARDGRPVPEAHALVVVTVDLGETPGWNRLTGMILAADALRETFDGGESLAALGASVVAAVVARDDGLAGRAVLLRRALTRRLHVDADLRDAGTPRIRLVRLPTGHDEACALLDRLRHT
ncbi:GGDEF domain-containing protein [Prauserella shujinwangii]|uniref:GGDEF domain-containing protein n=1 Tax=Prauserella shujinwangii TaxID=1453103 RepID=UPI003CCC0D46